MGSDKPIAMFVAHAFKTGLMRACQILTFINNGKILFDKISPS